VYLALAFPITLSATHSPTNEQLCSIVPPPCPLHQDALHTQNPETRDPESKEIFPPVNWYFSDVFHSFKNSNTLVLEEFSIFWTSAKNFAQSG
jgi:hypothetical protein